MLPFVEFLEEIERSNRTVVIGSAEVERLVRIFGNHVHSMGVWNHATDGSIEIPMSNITEAVQTLDNRTLTQAIAQLKTSEDLTGLLNDSPAAQQLIETLSKMRLRQFELKVQRYQNADDPAEVERLRCDISQELFGA
jgi:predicted regulator of amino acid metabolism with ACT domain